MSRYHVIDTTSGEVVRQYARIGSPRSNRYNYGAKRRSWLERQLATEKGRLILTAIIALFVGGSIF